MRGTPVELKVVLAVLLIAAAAGAGGAALAGLVFERQVEGTERRVLQAASDAFAAQQRSEVEKLGSTLDALLANEDLRRAFEQRDRDALIRSATPLFETMQDRDRITHWYFVEPDPSRAVFLRVHRPELSGDRIERVTFRRAVETGELGAGLELGKTAFALRVVRPWVHQGRVIGYMELAEEIDHFLNAMKARTGDEYGLLVKKKFLDEKEWARVLGPRASTWNDRPEVVVVDTTAFTDSIIDFAGDLEAIPDAGEALDEEVRGDRAFVRGIFPVRDAAGRQVGGLFVLHDFTAQHAAVRTGTGMAFLVLLTSSLGGAAVILALMHRLVFARLGRLRLRAEALAAKAGSERPALQTSADDLDRLEALIQAALPPRPPQV
jgi:hypothetical protein